MTAFDIHAPLTETEIATVSLALQTDMNVEALKEIVFRAHSRRVTKHKVNRPKEVDYKTLQKAIVKTTLFRLQHNLPLAGSHNANEGLHVQWWPRGKTWIFSFRLHETGEFTCETAFGMHETHMASYARGLIHDMPDVYELTWVYRPSDPSVPPPSHRFKLSVVPTTLLTYREFRVDLYWNEHRSSPSGSFEFYVKDRKTWHWSASSKGVGRDMLFTGHVVSDVETVLGHTCNVTAVRNLLTMLGFQDLTDLVEPAGSSSISSIAESPTP
jgi:hypothetical protein